MGETHKKFNLRVAEDDKTVLLDCDVSTDELEELVAAIGKELEALDIRNPPGQEQIIFQKKNIERVETEVSQLRNFTDSQMSSQNTAFISSQDELTKTLLMISELEKELQKVVDEVKDI